MEKKINDRICVHPSWPRPVHHGGIPQPSILVPEKKDSDVERDVYAVDFTFLEHGKNRVYMNGKDLNGVRYSNERVLVIGLEDALDAVVDWLDVMSDDDMEKPYEDAVSEFGTAFLSKDDYDRNIHLSKKRSELLSSARLLLENNAVPEGNTLDIDVLGLYDLRQDCNEVIDRISISNLGTFWGENDDAILNAACEFILSASKN